MERSQQGNCLNVLNGDDVLTESVKYEEFLLEVHDAVNRNRMCDSWRLISKEPSADLVALAWILSK